MSVTVRDVEYVAALARLELTAEEKATYTGQLNAILEYMEQLNRLDTDAVEPLSHVLPMTNVMREDEPAPPLPREEALRNSPDRSGKFFRVPNVKGDR